MTFLEELKRRNVVRVGAAYVALSWLIIQVAETLFPLFGLSDAAARLVVILLAIGFLPALVFAWVFEFTPEGLRRESEVDHDSDVSRRMTRRLDRLIMVFLTLALGYFALDKFVIDPARDAEELATATEQARQEGRSDAIVESYGDKSIAVLPFVNMSSDSEQEYFADGISEELLNLLARIPTLRVISRSSAFSFKGKDVNIPEVARQLNVAHVLEGSVRKSGDKIRITAQLIEARSDTHLWSETYDRTLDDIFAIQDNVAAAVVE
ncbi:MAG: adenylyl cyclase, partial [Gammaproteobacteria bacterium]